VRTAHLLRFLNIDENQMNRSFTEQKDLEAARQLGLTNDYTIVYMATHVAHIYDSEDVTNQLDETFIRLDDVEHAVNEAAISVELPKGFRLVGMRKIDGDESSQRHYGFVDFSDIGADVDKFLASRKLRQEQILTWARTTFGKATADNTGERIRRFAEEAVELAQAVGLEKQALLDIMEHVYAKTSGDVDQEIGQVGVSLLCLGQHLNIDADGEERKEFDRIKSLPADHWQARQNAKAAKGIALQSTPEAK
jgi:NTP pyrophosphatase (non-canonical NTP hydrolase)